LFTHNAANQAALKRSLDQYKAGKVQVHDVIEVDGEGFHGRCLGRLLVLDDPGQEELDKLNDLLKDCCRSPYEGNFRIRTRYHSGTSQRFPLYKMQLNPHIPSIMLQWRPRIPKEKLQYVDGQPPLE